MKSPKPEGIWKSLRIVIILLVANILLVTNFYIYSMYINNQSLDLSMNSQSVEANVTKKGASQKVTTDHPMVIGQMLGYDIPENYNVSVKSVSWPLTEQAIKNRTSACSTDIKATDITSVIDSYKGQKGAEFTFTKDGVEGSYVVTVYPNKRFGSFEEAQKILSNCPNGGQLLPKAVSASNLMLIDSCSDKGCDQIKSTIEPTLFVQ